MYNDNAKTPKVKSIAIVNQKGGCAKTTSAINIAAGLAKRGEKVLLVDTDPQGQAALGLGMEPDFLEQTLYEVLVDGLGLERVVRSTQVPNLMIVPANSLLSGAQIEMASVLGREAVLKTAINRYLINQPVDYVVIDCSPTLNLVTVNALVAAQYVLVPFQTHYFSLHGMKELFNTIEIVKERLNPDLEILGLFATLFDQRIKMNHQILGQVRDYFKEKVLDTVIHMNVKLCEAPLHRKPVFAYAPKSRGAVEYEKLTKEIIYRMSAVGPELALAH